jgi:hypothetical protein
MFVELGIPLSSGVIGGSGGCWAQRYDGYC